MMDTGQDKNRVKTGANTPLTPPPTDPALKIAHESFHSQSHDDTDLTLPAPSPALANNKVLFASDHTKVDVRPNEVDVKNQEQQTLQIPEAPAAVFNKFAFDRTIESLQDKTFQIETIPNSISLEDGAPQSREEMIKRAKAYLRYRIPEAYPEDARYTAGTRHTCLRSVWYWARKYAYYGQLDEYASGTYDIYEAVEAESQRPKYVPNRHPLQREGYEFEFQRVDKAERSVRADVVRRQMQVSTILNAESSPKDPLPKLSTTTVATPTIDHTTKQLSPLTPVSLPRVRKSSIVSKSTTKRKSVVVQPDDTDTDYHEEDEQDTKRRRTSSVSVQSKASKSKANNKGSRHTWDVNDPNYRAGSSERFCRFIKQVLNQRSSDKSDWKPFEDAVVPKVDAHLARYQDDKMPPPGRVPEVYGDSRGLHSSEKDLCHRLHITYDDYRCQKNRLFLGLAMVVEQNVRMLATNPNAPIWNVGPAQAQLYGSMDANKLSALWRAFIGWGWVHDMQEGNSKSKKGGTISKEYLERFPAAHRTKLINEMISWEDNVVSYKGNRVVERRLIRDE